MKIKFHRSYSVGACGYVLGIFILSELPARGVEGRIDLGPQLLWNFLHVPLFAGLAWCLLMSLSGGQWSQSLCPEAYGVVGFLAGGYALLDEWHQSFVAGRFASLTDLFLDCLGIVGLLVIHFMRRGWREDSRKLPSSSVSNSVSRGGHDASRNYPALRT